jgi:hypothetical protein
MVFLAHALLGPFVAERGRETGRRLDCSHLGRLRSRLSAVEQLMPVGVLFPGKATPVASKTGRDASAVDG